MTTDNKIFKCGNVKSFHDSSDASCVNDHISIRSMDFSEPLVGDYKGVELCRIEYIPCRHDSIARAEHLASVIISALNTFL